MATILVEIDGKTYSWDMDLDVAEDNLIHAATGLHYGQLMTAMGQPNSEKFISALQAIYWVLKRRSGENIDIRHANFKIAGFIAALEKGMQGAGLLPSDDDEVQAEDEVPNAPSTPGSTKRKS